MCELQDRQSGYEYNWAREKRAIAGAVLRAVESARSKAEECEELDRELRDIASTRSKLDVRETRGLRRGEYLQVWRHFGYPSMIAYLEYLLCYSPRTASDRLRVARALAELPDIEAALERGELSHSAVRELTRVASGATEHAWLDRARGKNLRDIEELVSGHAKGAHPDDPKDPDLRTRKVTIEMSAATFALYRQTQAALADETGHRLDEDEVIATMCRRSLETPSSAGDVPALARYQIAVTVCERCDRGWQHGAGAAIEIEPAAIAVAQCDAQHLGSIDGTGPTRAAQDVTPAMRRFVWRRDGGRCRVQGCRSARNLDVHHVEHRADGGCHEAWNLAVLCSGCHLALHRGLLTVSGTAPSFVFTRNHELREAFEATCASNETRGGSSALGGDEANGFAEATLRVQARDVLVAAGYRKHEAKAAVDAALAHLGVVSLERLLPEAFRRCKRTDRGRRAVDVSRL